MQIVFQSFHGPLERSNHRPPVPHRKTDGPGYQDVKGSRQSQGELKLSVELNVHVLAQLLDIIPQRLLPRFQPRQTFGNLEVGPRRCRLDSPGETGKEKHSEEEMYEESAHGRIQNRIRR